MGIKYLNSFLRNECKESIKMSSIAELSGKKIAVDISIYIYKYVGEGALIENMYLLLSIFRYYNVIPIFIFDGKPPPEKKDLLIKRKNDKKEAESEYIILEKKLKNNEEMNDYDKQEIISNMDLLKKKFITITKEQIDSVKELIRSYGCTYYDAPGEADELCALLVIKRKVWGCLSEDMDMFVYGCTNVIRYLSLLNHTVVIYDLKEILNTLKMTQKEFREICVLSGTDYNIKTDDSHEKCKLNLDKTLGLFKKYYKQKSQNPTSNQNPSFYDWLAENTNYICDYKLLLKIYHMFDLETDSDLYHTNLHIFDKIKVVNGPIIMDNMKKILKEDGFIFP